MSAPLPFQIREAVVTVLGRAFWLKDPFRSFLLSCGVAPDLYDRFAEESKYKIARHVLSELDRRGAEGLLIQKRIVSELVRLRNIPDATVPDRDAALQALRVLKQLVVEHKIDVVADRTASESRTVESKRKQEGIAARAEKVAQLRKAFASMAVATTDPQSRGYGLEDLLAELFEVHEIPYRRPYKTASEQIDGHFDFLGFSYLVEARWRSGSPNQADLGAFKLKVDKKLSSTRGLFVSISGFRPEMVTEVTRGVSSNIVLMDGSDLSLILEGHVSLTDGLDIKVKKAAQEGIIFFPLVRTFG